MSSITIRRGVNIRLKGTAEKIYAPAITTETVSVKPPDFHGLTPKLIAKVGDEVKAGTPLFYDKNNEKIKFVSPVSGEIVEVNRGEKRRVLDIRILADKEIRYEKFSVSDTNTLNGDQIKEHLLSAGLWPFIRQRPYSVIANPDKKPKSIFISGFNSAPLAPDNDFVIHGHGDLFQLGLDAVAKLTTGKVHLNLYSDQKASGVFTHSKNVQINYFDGPHPAGNIGVQIHHLDPLNKGEVIWYLCPQDVLMIGRLFKEGRHNASRVVALTGSCVKKPKYYRTVTGTCVKELLKDNLHEGNHRVISGNILTGTKISSDGYLGYYDDSICVIPEGDQPEFMGWLNPGPNKFSLSRTFLTWLNPKKEFDINSNMHGEERAYVMSGQYESIFPMDIYPVHLVKAIMIGDIELMENLGIYEVAPEDFALCEFACTSKIKVQEIVRQGLDLIQKECG